MRSVVKVGSSSWWETGSTTRPRLPPPTSGWRWALGGATASSEAADVVLVVDRLDRLVEAMTIAKRSHTIAVQSVLMGMGVAFGFMFLGAFGLFEPVAAAIVQKAIDVASILNALRALGGGAGPRSTCATHRRARRFRRAPALRRPSCSASARWLTASMLAPDEARTELEPIQVRSWSTGSQGTRRRRRPPSTRSSRG